MLDLPRLPIERQRNVSASLSAHLDKKPKYKPEVLTAAKAVISAGESLAISPVAGAPSMPVVDRATDSVTAAIFHTLENIEKAGNSSAIAPDAATEKSVEAAELLLATWFSGGVGFIQLSFGLQWDALNTISRTFTQPAVVDAVETLALGPLVGHWKRHIDLYGKTLGITSAPAKDAPQAESSDVFHQAFVTFAATVMTFLGSDTTAQDALLGPYRQQLDELRVDRQNAEKKRRRKKATEPSA